MRAAVRCDIGVVRATNQDVIFCSDEPIGTLENLYIVADGMGGHKAGEVAAQEAVQAFVHAVRTQDHQGASVEEILSEALREANRSVYELAGTDHQLEGMGTTLVALTTQGEQAYCINVGDSRLYVLEDTGMLQTVTRDHSLVADLVRRGQITEEEALVHPHRNVITRAIGIDAEIEGDLYDLSLSKVQKLLLCSDGLYSMVSDQEAAEIMREDTDLEHQAEALLLAAKEAGGRDNISIIVVGDGGDTNVA